MIYLENTVRKWLSEKCTFGLRPATEGDDEIQGQKPCGWREPGRAFLNVRYQWRSKWNLRQGFTGHGRDICVSFQLAWKVFKEFKTREWSFSLQRSICGECWHASPSQHWGHRQRRRSPMGNVDTLHSHNTGVTVKEGGPPWPHTCVTTRWILQREPVGL